MKNKQEKIKYSFLFFLLILLDQYSKLYVLRNYKDKIFENHNFAFSIVLPKGIIYAVYIVLVVALVYWFKKKTEPNTLEKIGFVLILSGALSNITERMIRGYVIDFIHIHTGILNIADFLILLGVALFLFTTPNKIKAVN